MKTLILSLLIAFTLAIPARADETDSAGSAAASPAPEKAESTAKASPAKSPTEKKADKAHKGTIAEINTTAGKITIKLWPDKAPKTVENFIGLATGKKAWTDPKTGKDVKGKPLYNGTIFHRVIPGFMIQGGDPMGTGMGGPGYAFEDETSPSDSFDRPGLLAMANSGPNTNGSQFFITDKATPWLNGHHTIFGEVTSGMDVVEKIINAPKGANDRPDSPVSIKSIKIK
jgi:peptidyl-prolyl cis-trans isomerase A (cyclophilin A)